MLRNLSVLLCFIFPLIALAKADAASSNIIGVVEDAQTGRALPGAIVFLKGTSFGASTGINGKYDIRNVPSGTYQFRVSYIGYKTLEVKIKVPVGGTLQKNFKLVAIGVKGKTVVVTAQAMGQNEAINEQLSSNSIESVVSAAKITQLPDENAAESVGRLPGVFVLRSGGQGYAVVIRGMAPQYNQITIDGIQMGSSNPSDRSTNLSMISSNMLEGIQVKKTVTPAMDANVIGGVVNFTMRQAQVKTPGVPRFSLIAQGGYNNLPDAYNKFNNYKYVASVEDRLLNNKLGIFAQLDVERVNLSSNELSSSYTHNGNSLSQYLITGVTLSDIPRDKRLYNGALDLDYEYSGGSLKLWNFLSTGATSAYQRSQSFDIGSNVLYYGISNASNVLTTISNVLDYKQKLPVFTMNVRLGHTYSETTSPNNWSVQFMQSAEGGLNQFSSALGVTPQEVVNTATPNLSQTDLYYLENNSNISQSSELTGSVDFKTDVALSKALYAKIQFGGESQYLTRSYGVNVFDTPQLLNSGSAVAVDNIISSRFSLPTGNFQIPITDFLDPTYNYGTFLNGNYSMHAPLSFGMMSELATYMKSKAQYIAQNIGPANYGHDNYASTIPDYSGHENPNAAYAMATVNLGRRATVLGGVRFQTYQSSYTGVAGVTSPESYFAYSHYDTTMTRYDGYWLPDVSLKYDPVSWSDIRLSYTNTLAYPSYSAFVPRINLSDLTVGWNNNALVPAHSVNYDASVSFYDNAIGLFSVDGFYKQIRNMIYGWQFFVKGAAALPYLPLNLANFNPNATYDVTTTENNPYLNKVYGVELDWQTHFWYLPGILSGMVLDINYTHTKSIARYPYVLTVSNGRNLSYIDTSFSDRLVDQPNNIFNLSLGLDYKGFSARVAMEYSADIFTAASQWPQLRGYSAAYTRWDAEARQQLPWNGLELYADFNNITAADNVQLIQAGVPTAISDYGFSADMGLRWRL